MSDSSFPPKKNFISAIIFSRNSRGGQENPFSFCSLTTTWLGKGMSSNLQYRLAVLSAQWELSRRVAFLSYSSVCTHQAYLDNKVQQKLLDWKKIIVNGPAALNFETVQTKKKIITLTVLVWQSGWIYKIVYRRIVVCSSFADTVGVIKHTPCSHWGALKDTILANDSYLGKPPN